jgi:8-oxo-dGTP pyrophosphatase MutT (NUDIX family)
MNSKNTFENPLIVVAGVFFELDDKTKVRVFKKISNGLFELPGGKAQAHESENDALSRELWEELGVRAEVLDFIGQAYTDNGYLLKAYQVKTSDHWQLKEHSETQLVCAQTMETLPMNPANKTLVQLALQRSGLPKKY